VHCAAAYWILKRVTRRQWWYARLNPHKDGEGLYFVWDTHKKRFRVLKVFDDGADLVVDDGRKYNPYVGAMSCYWLLKIEGEREG
jgi:hypothetical protein